MNKDSLGDRIKHKYEDRTRYFLPRRTYTIIRLDGKAFHTFTKGFNRPYDHRISYWMDTAALELCKEIQGVEFAYTQSDEISLLLTDFFAEKTEAWFDGNIQKIVSVASSIATCAFNKAKMLYEYNSVSEKFALEENNKWANFDARVFTIPDTVEVANYFIWRQQDAVRNSISMLAQSLYSHKELLGKNSSEQKELCFQKGKNWNDVSVRNKRGGFVAKIIEDIKIENRIISRSKFKNIECPHFTCDNLSKYIPSPPLFSINL